jgi:hypothetical protein
VSTSRQRIPADFSSFVEAHSDRLQAACDELTGHDILAHVVARDLLASVALRWRWWRLRGRASRAGRAERYLDRILRREARAWPRGRDDVRPSYRLEGETRAKHPAERRWATGGPTRIRLIEASALPPAGTPVDADPVGAAAQLAGAAWTRAGRVRANRILVATVAVVVVGCLAVASPRLASRLPTPLPPDPIPSVLPAGVVVLPAFDQLGTLSQLGTLFRAVLDLDPAAPPLRSQPLTRAIAVVRHETGPLYAVAPDASLRVIDDPALAEAQLLSTSLSPDGQRAALGGPDGLLIVDLTTGAVRPISTGGPPAVLAWRGNRSLLTPNFGGSLLVDVDTGSTGAIGPVTGQDIVTAQAGTLPAPLVELIPTGRSPRIRLWRNPPSAAPNPTSSTASPGDLEDRPIFGPPWIGHWSGPGYGGGDLLVRGCAGNLIAMPAGRGVAGSAVGAVNTTGLYASTLVTVDDTQLDLLGFADPKTVLINATGDRGSVIVAWSPNAGTMLRVTALNTTARISLAAPTSST